MHARPYLLVGATALESARARARGAVEAWRESWGFDAAAAPLVSCLRASEADSLHGYGWRAWHKDGIPGAWVRETSDEREASRSIAQAVAERARTDLVTSLLAAFGAPRDGAFAAEPIPHDAQAAETGMVLVRVSSADAMIELLVSSAPVAHRDAPHRLPPRPALEAVRRATVRLSAEIGEVEIDLRALRSLAPGDVVRLGRSLDQPLALVASDGATVCHGHLGAHAGKRALDVVP